MILDLGNLALVLFLTGISMFAWRRRRAVGGKTWAFRILPIGIILMRVISMSIEIALGCVALTFIVYAIAVFCGGWRLQWPRNPLLRRVWWGVHVVVYFVLIFALCFVLASVVCAVVRFSPLGEFPWTRGRITDELPFAVEYKRAKTLCPEYDKRILFKSGKRIGLLIDTCGYGPFQVYLLKDGDYCLVDGFDERPGYKEPRYLRVNVKSESVELKVAGSWFPVPEQGYVRGWGGSDELNLDFFMYPGGDLNGEGWSVSVKGTLVGDSLEGMEFIGVIYTSGKFVKDDE